MTLEYAVLGFLSYQPFTGYDLKKMFDTSVRHFWSADQSQIYRTLAKLTDLCWADCVTVEQSDRPDRKVYHITEAGRIAFLEWLRGPFPVQDNRSGPLVQVFFSANLDDEAVIAKFEMAVEIFRTVLARYEQVPQQAETYMQQVPSPRDHYFWMLTLDLGVRTMRANLEWAESVLAAARAGKIPQNRMQSPVLEKK